MKILITGGAGYIGSTICSALKDHGHTPIILDSLVTGREEFTRGHIFYKADIADRKAVQQVFIDHPDIFATIHCAALIVVPESVSKPYDYYRENVVKSMQFFYQLAELGFPRVVFSSSAAIYDVVPGFMVTEESPLKPNSPYSRTKYMMEMVLQDFAHAYGLKAIALRYFNPIGADPQNAVRDAHSKAQPHPWQAGRSRNGRGAGLQYHRYGLAYPGWHRHPGLRPRLGPGDGARESRREIRFSHPISFRPANTLLGYQPWDGERRHRSGAGHRV